MDNPELEYVKFIMEIISLDPMFKNEVLIMKKNLFKLLKMGEFTS